MQNLAQSTPYLPKLLIVPGRSAQSERQNTPATATTLGLTNVLYIKCLVETTIYVELGGAQGGNVSIYSNGVDFDGNPTAQAGYVGGFGGFVSGLLDLRVGDALKVHLGTAGSLETDPTGSAAPGQGGLGTIFGGANGGGATYIVKYNGDPVKKDAAIERAFANLPGDLLAVAAGGGGASRNAAGGAGGFSDVTTADGLFLHTAYGDKSTAPSSGSYGGTEFILGSAPHKVAFKAPTGYAGGSGLNTTGGFSSVPSQVPKNGSFGGRLNPFVNRAGGSVETSSGTGGGGGGMGQFGGGAGGYNGLAKPNNVHGGGGGGSSFSKLRSPNEGPAVSLNIYRSLPGWPFVVDNPLVPSVSTVALDGYMVLGVVNE